MRVSLGALIVKEKKKISHEELVEDIRESPYLQYFLGYEGYKDELPFDPSMMVHFRKRLSGNILKEVNALIIEKSKADDERRDDGDEGKGAGEGKRRYTLDRIGTKLRSTSESAIHLVFLVINLMVLYRRKAKAFFVALFDTLFEMVRRAFWEANLSVCGCLKD